MGWNGRDVRVTFAALEIETINEAEETNMLEPLFIIWISCTGLSNAFDCMRLIVEVGEILPSCEARGEIVFQGGASKPPVTASIKFECREWPSSEAWMAWLRDNVNKQ